MEIVKDLKVKIKIGNSFLMGSLVQQDMNSTAYKDVHGKKQ